MSHSIIQTQDYPQSDKINGTWILFTGKNIISRDNICPGL